MSDLASVRLTKTAKRAGCAAKHPPGYLLPLLSGLPAITDPRVLVGSNTSDDAAIVRIAPDRALVLTTDFFTPIVDDPFEFGQVAAANALSYVYAMGGVPISALGIVGFPDHDLAPEILAEILRGGALKAKEAGIDVVGEVHPDWVVTNAGAKAGDRLVLTKPLGIGVIATANKNDADTLGAMPEAVRLMTTLNRAACDAMLEVGVHAATDVTGFGLLGHLRNVCAASGVSAHVRFDAVPVLAAARRYVGEGMAPGGTHANWRFLADWVTWASDVTKEEQLLLADAQTSGGLLIAVAPEKTDALVAALIARGTPAAAVVGEIVAGPAGHMDVTRA